MYMAADIRETLERGRRVRTFVWTRGLWLIYMAIVIILVLAAYFYFTSDAGARTIDTIKEKGTTAYRFIPGIFTRAEAVGMNAWEAENTAGVGVKSGIVFKDFQALSLEVPQGAQLTASYNLGIENADLDPTRVDIECKIKGKEIIGEIIPADIILEGRRVTRNVRCIFSPEQTAQIQGTETIVGKVSYPYKTKDVALPVYFTTLNYFNEKTKSEKDFFRAIGAPISNPIKAEYNGEPIEVGIGVSTENIQPVIIEEGVEALVGITLTNKWSGRVKELKDLRLEVPIEMTISELSNAPNLMCPFIASREGRVFREYVMDDDFLNKVELKMGSRQTFECYFDVDDVLLEHAMPYTSEYRVTADYIYELPEKTVSVTIKKTGEEEVLAEEGAVTEVEVEV